MTSDELLSALRSDQQLRNEISEAKVVTFFIGGRNALVIVFSGVPDIRKALAPWRETFDAIIDEIVSLRSTSDTIIRTIDYPNPWVSRLKKQGIFDQVSANSAVWIEQIAEAASEHNIPVARAYLAMNGASGDEDPATKSYIVGDPLSSDLTPVRLSDAGNRLIAGRAPTQTRIQTLRPMISPLPEGASSSRSFPWPRLVFIHMIPKARLDQDKL